MMSSTASFFACLEGLMSGHLTVEQAHALTRRHEDAQAVVLRYLKQRALHVPAHRGEWGLKLLELVWRMEGPSACVHEHFIPVNKQAVEQFYLVRIHSSPEVFTDEDLRAIRTLFDGCGFINELIKVQSARLAVVADKLLANPEELSADVKEVQKHVSGYRFNPELNGLMDKVEAELHSPSDGFDRAATLKHLRTFFEKLHEQVSDKLRELKPETKDGTDLTSCGQAIDFLSRKEVLTEKMKAMGKGLYGVLSNEGVHAPTTQQEYVRLCRNMVAEYALVLFHELKHRLA